MIVSKGREAFAKYCSQETFARIKEYDTVTQMWRHCVTEYSDDIAVIFDGVQHTFAELEEDAAMFRGIVSDCGERIGIFSANSYDLVKAFIAVVTSGKTAFILPAQLDEMSVFGCAMKYGLSAVVCQEALLPKTALLTSKAPIVKVIDISAAGGEKKEMTDCEAGTPCVAMFTGGTTGKSKAALLSNGAVMQGTVNGCYGYEHVFAQRYLLLLPLSHVFGLIRNLLTSLYTGSTLYISKSNQDMFRDIAVFRPTILVAVPALAEMALTLSRKFSKNMLGEDMKYIICGAAAVAPYLVKEYEKLGIALFPGYGLTESANLVSGNPESSSKPSSVGIPYPHQEFRIVDGELWIKGLNMMDGYISEPDEQPYTDGWFRTGDLVRFDEDGFLYITGRIKEIIILDNGENVSPAEVEAHFNELVFVQDSQIFEDLDESGKHILALEIVPRATELAALQTDDVNAYMMEQLRKVNESLPAFQRASRIVIRDKDFDRTPSMKIARYKKCQ